VTDENLWMAEKKLMLDVENWKSELSILKPLRTTTC
jgi:hypothetical protein